jgi:hypothetical protein
MFIILKLESKQNKHQLLHKWDRDVAFKVFVYSKCKASHPVYNVIRCDDHITDACCVGLRAVLFFANEGKSSFTRECVNFESPGKNCKKFRK